MSKIIENIIREEIQKKGLFYPFISGITPREKTILEMRENKETLEIIGEKFGISRQRASQIEEKAKRKIEKQGKIIKKLAKRISKSTFTEQQIGDAFMLYLREVLPPGETTGEANHYKLKLKWMGFNKYLWNLKNKKK